MVPDLGSGLLHNAPRRGAGRRAEGLTQARGLPSPVPVERERVSFSPLSGASAFHGRGQFRLGGRGQLAGRVRFVLR